MMNFREQVQKEANEILLKFDCGTANVAMRLGKTVLGLKIASNFNKVLVSYPIETIKDGWLSDSKEFGFDISNITFTTHLSLSKHNLKKLYKQCQKTIPASAGLLLDVLCLRH